MLNRLGVHAPLPVILQMLMLLLVLHVRRLRVRRLLLSGLIIFAAPPIHRYGCRPLLYRRRGWRALRLLLVQLRLLMRRLRMVSHLQIALLMHLHLRMPTVPTTISISVTFEFPQSAITITGLTYSRSAAGRSRAARAV